MPQQANQPVQSFRAGPVSAAIWSKEVTHEKRTFTQYSVKVEKRYYDEKEKDWKSTPYVNARDLPKMALVVSKAYEWIMLEGNQEEE